ncbi:uncharacterized protein YpbB [Evansella vedderi]|uniref:Uncharacterized protein YpbB n=1 Tax=Evansella vedderi TaxID=38282 RepID=A0ABU0A2G7_9BACI|nr:helix-turn-helix domain-containing protein [Evansella vedderi]MDQ0257677.1 uncharacterized protein YpbB [Evansella vedderi]
MNCFNWLMLQLINYINEQRTIGGIYHLLKGKRSAQTIQDAYLFKCSEYVGSLKALTRQDYTEGLKKLEDMGWICFQGSETIKITESGERKRRELSRQFQLPEGYDGAKYEWNGSAGLLWERLSLTVQSLSFLNRGQTSFLPVSYHQETQMWVKQLFKYHSNNYRVLAERLHLDLYNFLTDLPEREGNLFVNRLTSPMRTGKTFKQLSEAYQNDPLYARIHFQAILHRCFVSVKGNQGSYPMLSQFLFGINEHQFVTKSAKETSRLLKQGRTIEEVKMLRGLKHSTIEDHLIELALYEPNFSYKPYLTYQHIKDVLSVASKLKTKKLRLIKEQLPQLSYFQIRLALTKQR